MEGNKHGLFDSFRKKFLANKVAFESVLFDKDKPKEEKKKDYKIVFYFSIIFLIFALLNFIYFYKYSQFLSYNDIKSFEYIKSYLSFNIRDILTYTDITHMNFDMPLYYIMFIPLIKFLNISFSWSIYIINLICLLLSCFAIYYLLNSTRNKYTALYGVILFLSMPYIVELSRSFSPSLFTIVMVLWSYFLYIKVEKFEDTKYVGLFIVIYSIGLLSDKFFIIYTLPMINFISFLYTTQYSTWLTRVLLPSFIVSSIFYLRFIVLGIFKYSFCKINLNNFWNFNYYFKEIINSTGILFFIFLSIFFLWLYLSTYLQYSGKKALFKWLFFPLIIFSIFPITDLKLIYPLIPALIIGGVIMIPPFLRKYLIFITILFSLLSSTMLLNPLYSSGGYRIFGVKNIKYEQNSIKSIFKALKEEMEVDYILSGVIKKLNRESVIVGVKTNAEYLNYYSLNNFKNKYMLDNIRFVNYPEELYNFLDYLILDKKELNNFISDGQFKQLISIGDIVILKKNRKYKILNLENTNTYHINEINIKDFKLTDVDFTIFGFDEHTGISESSIIYCKYASYKGIDIYGLKLKLNDFSFSKDSNIFVTGFSSLEILDAKISDFSFYRYIEDLFGFDKIELSFMDDVLSIKINLFNNITLTVYGSIYCEDNIMFFKTIFLHINGIKIPNFITSFLNFKYDISKSNIPIKINHIKITNGVIYIK